MANEEERVRFMESVRAFGSSDVIPCPPGSPTEAERLLLAMVEACHPDAEYWDEMTAPARSYLTVRGLIPATP